MAILQELSRKTISKIGRKIQFAGKMFSNNKLQPSCSELQFDKFEDSIDPNGNLQKKS